MPKKTATRLDASERIFAETQLTQVANKAYETDRPKLEGLDILPVTREFGEGARTISWFEWNQVAIAAWLANGADDLPRVDVFGEQHFSRVRGLGNAYGYTFDDIRQAQMADVPLEQRRANAARDGHEQFWDRVAFYGDDTRGIKGLFTTPNTNDVIASTAAASPNGLGWLAASGKTPDEIIDDMCRLHDSVRSATSGVHVATDMVIAADAYSYISCTPRASNSDTTILEFFKKTRPGVNVMSSETFNAVTTLPSGASGTASVAMAYVKNVDLLAYALTMDFLQHAPQLRNLEFTVPCESKVGGLIVWKPLTISFMEDLDDV